MTIWYNMFRVFSLDCPLTAVDKYSFTAVVSFKIISNMRIVDLRI